jgi:hypothetical protein
VLSPVWFHRYSSHMANFRADAEALVATVKVKGDNLLST